MLCTMLSSQPSSSSLTPNPASRNDSRNALKTLVRRLHSITDAQVAQAASLLVRAYEGYPSQKALLGGNWDLHADYFTAMIRAIALEGEIFVVQPQGSDEILSISLWTEPDHDMFSTHEQRALGFDHFFRRLSPMAQMWWHGQCSAITTELMARSFTDEERQRCFWCCELATDPRYQRHGFASAMISHVRNSRTPDQIIGLSTPAEVNVMKYQKMGFCERGRAIMKAATGSFPVIVMSLDC